MSQNQIKLILLFIVVMGLLSSLTSCGKSTIVAKTNLNTYIEVTDKSQLYLEGDSVHVYKGLGENRWYINDNPIYLRDTTILTSDSTALVFKRVLVLYRK